MLLNMMSQSILNFLSWLGTKETCSYDMDQAIYKLNLELCL